MRLRPKSAVATPVIDLRTGRVWSRPVRRRFGPALRLLIWVSVIGAGLACLLAAAAAAWIWWYSNQLDSSSREQLLKAVGRMIMLPSNEEPVIATVADHSQFANQPFLAQAQNGDRLLIYLDAKKVYIYRPALHKLVDVGPVSINPNELKP